MFAFFPAFLPTGGGVEIRSIRTLFYTGQTASYAVAIRSLEIPYVNSVSHREMF
jgi:hypothetical protein